MSYKFDLKVEGNCTSSSKIHMVNTYAYQNEEPVPIVLNRPGSKRTIDLEPYFADIKQVIGLRNDSSCSQIEYIIQN